MAMGAARLIELAYSRRNISGAGESREGGGSRKTYPLMVALHTVVIVVTALAGQRVRWPWLLILLAVQPLRAWVIATLGRNWNTRGAVSDRIEVQTGGPYAYVRHPNYVVVAIELAALPLAFGMRGLALAATVANVLLLAIRIPEEEALLNERPEYREHFEKKARFIPGVF